MYDLFSARILRCENNRKRVGIFDSSRDATSNKLDASWPTFARSRCAGERVGGARARWKGQRMYRIFPSWKNANGEEKANAPSRRFWGVEVERPVKNVIKMCLELPRGKEVMNIKRALEAPDAAIYIDICASNRVHAAARLILRRNKRIHSSALNDFTHNDNFSSPPLLPLPLKLFKSPWW